MEIFEEITDVADVADENVAASEPSNDIPESDEITLEDRLNNISDKLDMILGNTEQTEESEEIQSEESETEETESDESGETQTEESETEETELDESEESETEETGEAAEIDYDQLISFMSEYGVVPYQADQNESGTDLVYSYASSLQEFTDSEIVVNRYEYEVLTKLTFIQYALAIIVGLFFILIFSKRKK